MELIDAAKSGELELVKQFLADRLHNVASKDENGCTAAHWAAYGSHAPVLGALVNAGANVCALNKKGESPLHYIVAGLSASSSSGSTSAVEESTRILLNAGADAAALDSDSHTAMDLASALLQSQGGESSSISTSSENSSSEEVTKLKQQQLAQLVVRILKEDAINLTSAAKHLQQHMLVDLNNHVVALQRELPVVQWTSAGAALKAREAPAGVLKKTLSKRKSLSMEDDAAMAVAASAASAGDDSAKLASWFDAAAGNPSASGDSRLPCNMTATFLDAMSASSTGTGSDGGGGERKVLLANAQRDFKLLSDKPALLSCYTQFMRTMSSAIAANHSLVMGLLNDPRGRQASAVPAPPEQVLDFLEGLSEAMTATHRGDHIHLSSAQDDAALAALQCLKDLFSAKCHNNAQCVRAVKRVAARFPVLQSHCMIEIVGRSLCMYLNETGALDFSGKTGSLESTMADGCAKLTWLSLDVVRAQSLVQTFTTGDPKNAKAKLGPQHQQGSLVGLLLAYGLLEHLALTDPAVEARYSDAAGLMHSALQVLGTDAAAAAATSTASAQSLSVLKVDGVEMNVDGGGARQEKDESVNDIKNWIKKTTRSKPRSSFVLSKSDNNISTSASRDSAGGGGRMVPTDTASGSVDLGDDFRSPDQKASHKRQVSDTTAQLSAKKSIHLSPSQKEQMDREQEEGGDDEEEALQQGQERGNGDGNGVEKGTSHDGGERTESTSIEQSVESVRSRTGSASKKVNHNLHIDVPPSEEDAVVAATASSPTRNAEDPMVTPLKDVSGKSGESAAAGGGGGIGVDDVPLELQSPAPYRNTTAVTSGLVPANAPIVPLELQSPAPYRGTDSGATSGSHKAPFAETPPRSATSKSSSSSSNNNQPPAPAAAPGGCCVIS